MPAKSAPRRRKATHKGNASARHGATTAPTKTASVPAVVHAQRGWLLTAMYIIMAVHGVFNTVALIALRRTDYYTNIPAWLYGGAILVGIATIVSAVALWYWKRWGLYLYVVATFGSMALGLIVFASPLAAFYNIIPLAILGYVLTFQRKMQLLA
jgi:hypothetical protein